MTDQYFIFDDIDIDICNEMLENKTMKRLQENIIIQENIVIIENYF